MDDIEFLSTPSARRATDTFKTWRRKRPISIHALREEGDVSTVDTPLPKKFSIHALREEGDHGIHTSHLTSHPFLSTPSARRATGDDLLHLCCLAHISIHALREEGDCAEIGMSAAKGQFLSTPSARRATSLKV